MKQIIPTNIEVVRELVHLHEPPDRIWALGSANGFANWMFLRRLSIDRYPSRFVAQGYIEELIERDRGGAYGEGEIALEAALLQMRLKAVNHARSSVANLVSIAKRQHVGFGVWDCICELATSNDALARAQAMPPGHASLLEATLDMVAFFARPLLLAPPTYQPTSDGNGEADLAMCIALKHIDVSLQEEPEWDAVSTDPYVRPELEALVRLADDAAFLAVIHTTIEHAERFNFRGAGICP